MIDPEITEFEAALLRSLDECLGDKPMRLHAAQVVVAVGDDLGELAAAPDKNGTPGE
ncbi:MAG: hypothetical protein H7274_23770 [Rhodoferax sp.]|nr:hypothetical protein [Rhodoferax sp.]